jgi:hypothetical protein
VDREELKKLLIDVIEEEFSPAPIAIGKRWEGGILTLAPGNDSQSKEIPLEVFFGKITGMRESLRVLEQKINNCDALGDADKATFQSYITKCYGSLTSFNILFKEDKDKFVGAGKGVKDSEPTMTMGQARKKLNLNEY